MRHLFLALGLTLGLALPTLAEDDQGAAIQNTIQSQIDAFQADDFSTAFTFASPSIQSMFRTPENFGTMVRNGYPMVWRPGSVTYGPLRDHAGGLWQQVTITDQKGARFELAYRMVQSEHGWKIAGVVILEEADLSA